MKWNKSAAVAFGALCAVLTLCGACRSTGVHPVVPKGFAAEVNPDDALDEGVIFRAVNPEGVAYRVRVVDHEPRAKLAFWKDTLERHLKDSGYVMKGASKLKSGKSDGWLLDFVAPLADANFRFLVAIYERGSDLVVAEAGGDLKTFDKAMPAIKKALASLRFD